MLYASGPPVSAVLRIIIATYTKPCLTAPDIGFVSEEFKMISWELPFFYGAQDFITAFT
jgi:hypothetical protein